MKALLEGLLSGDDQQAEAAASQLASLGTAALPALRALLDSLNPEGRWWAVRTLAEIQNPQVAPLLRAALADPDPAVRQCTALALRIQPDPQALPGLLALLKDGDRLTVRLAADALGALGKPAVPALLHFLESNPQDNALMSRLEAMRTLAGSGDLRAIPALFAALEDRSPLIRHWAEIGLERMSVGMVFFDTS